METTSSSLLERLRTPNAGEGWPRFVKLYTPLLFYWARKTGLQEQDAADLVQEVFAHLLEKLPEFTYDRQKSFRGWLRIVTLNKWREKNRRASLPINPNQPITSLKKDSNPAEIFWQREYHQHLARRALELMKAEFKESTWKACWEMTVNGKGAEKVAAELGLTLGAVYAAKSRVLRRLRAELDGLLD